MSEQKLYTIGKVSTQTKIPISTLHYYDKKGLLPLIKRSPGGNRLFDEMDLEIIYYIDCFKRAGMTLKQIKTYFDLYKQGEQTAEQRQELLHHQLLTLEQQIHDMNEAKNVLLKKIKELH